MAFKAFLIEQDGQGVKSGFARMEPEQLDAGEVDIRVSHSSINYKDALAATGKGRIIRRFPCVGGIDLAGTVLASSDPRFSPGEAVLATSYDIGVAHHGGYAEQARIPAAWVVKLPPGLTAAEAMALGTAGFTAALAVVRMEHDGLAPDKGKVLVNGATGGVGSLAIAMLAQRGYHVVALTGKDTEFEYLTRLGAREIMQRQSLDLSKLKPLGSETWAGAVDNLGGDVLSWLASTMQVGGTLASVGLAAGFHFNTTVMPFILRGVSLLGIDSVNCPMPQRAEVWRRLGADLKPPQLDTLTRHVPFESLPQAFNAFVAGQVRGRTVVDIQP